MGFTELFPVQAAAWRQLAGGLSGAHDLCIAAPTGSGKTLAYCLPLLQALAAGGEPAGFHALRALVVLPTRDLAAQVHRTLATLCPPLGLRACLAAGQRSVAEEAAELVGGPAGADGGADADDAADALLSASLARLAGGGADASHAEAAAAAGPRARAGAGRGADVMVATPGRLVAHLGGTRGFSLSALRFLVVDETDRLLRQAYQGWLPAVLGALAPGGGEAPGGGGGGSGDAGAAAAAPLPQRVVKLIVSATLTRDPSKLARLALVAPRYVAMSAGGEHHRYKLPEGLREFKAVVASGRDKPAALLALLAALAGKRALVFTSSLDATRKLALLLAAVADAPGSVVEFSSHLSGAQRAANLAAFRAGEATVLVASDGMTRGMDVDCVDAVVNYDAPVYAKTYVHRAGRTARAGARRELLRTLVRRRRRRRGAAASRTLLPAAAPAAAPPPPAL